MPNDPDKFLVKGKLVEIADSLKVIAATCCKVREFIKSSQSLFKKMSPELARPRFQMLSLQNRKPLLPADDALP